MVHDMKQRIFKGVIRSVDENEYTVEAVISDETVDRYNEVILSKAWEEDLERYKNHPVLLSSHNYGGLTSQIGEAVRIGVSDGRLTATFKYFVGEGNPEADWGFKLASKGIAAFSVGFVPLEFENSEVNDQYGGLKSVKVYSKVELIEVSQVLVPANPQALQKGMEADDPVVRSIAAQISRDALTDEQDIDPVDDNEEIIEPPLEQEPCADLLEEPDALIHVIRPAEDFIEESLRTVKLMEDIYDVYMTTGEHSENGLTLMQSLKFPTSDGWEIADASAWLRRNPTTSDYLENYLINLCNRYEREASIKSDETVMGMIEDAVKMTLSTVCARLDHTAGSGHEGSYMDMIFDELSEVDRVIKVV